MKTGLYSAEYGVRPGGQISAVTKSGSNQFHGNLYWFHRNDNLDARNFFEQRKAEFKRNQLGATLGGPILAPGLFDGRDRAWFFLSYQLRSIRETRPLTGVVPTDAEKRGEFPSPILDPAIGQFFPGDRLPEHRLDPVARKLLHFWPSPNTPGPLNFTSPDSKANLDNPQLISRLDFATTPGSRWTGRFIWDSSPQVSPPHLQRLLRGAASADLWAIRLQHPHLGERPDQRGEHPLVFSAPTSPVLPNSSRRSLRASAFRNC